MEACRGIWSELLEPKELRAELLQSILRMEKKYGSEK